MTRDGDKEHWVQATMKVFLCEAITAERIWDAVVKSQMTLEDIAALADGARHAKCIGWKTEWLMMYWPQDIGCAENAPTEHKGDGVTKEEG